MRHRILLLVAAGATLGSCTTMYKSGQTPDDVYYSPAREVPGYVETKQTKENPKTTEDYSDAYLRMKTYDRTRWSTFDNDYLYWNDWRWNNQVYYNTCRPVGSYGYAHSYGSPYTGYYSPYTPGYYGAPVIIINPKPYNPRAYTPRTGNLNTYIRTGGNYATDPKTGARTYNISSPSAPTRTTRGAGYYYDSNGNTRYQSGTTNPSRSLDNNSNNSRTNTNTNSGTRSSGSSGSGGSAPVRSFPKGGGR